MTQTEFKEGLLYLWGDAWRERAPKALECSLSTLDRYASGRTKVFGPAAVAVRLMIVARRADRARRARRREETAA